VFPEVARFYIQLRRVKTSYKMFMLS